MLMRRARAMDRDAQPTSRTLAITTGVALAAGFVTAYAQEWLPSELGSFANSAGPWTLIAFGLALGAVDLRTAVFSGVLALLALLTGYVLGAGVRGFASGSALVAFWGAAALIAGPAIGAAAHWVSADRGRLAAAGAGVISGVMIGEGAYGLAFIADTTYPPYWWGETVAGAGLLVAFTLVRKVRPADVATALAVAAVSATTLVVLYRSDLIALLP
jgi:hypothetical protein